jgi:streptomycin 6-kinase
MLELPSEVAGMAGRGPAWQAWVEALPDLVGATLGRWGLRSSGTPITGARSVLVPVVSSEDRTPALLKLSHPDTASEHEHIVLRRWSGRGAVRLLRADPHHGAVLLERLRPRDLGTVDDVEACQLAAGLYRRLHISALPQLPSLDAVVAARTAELEELPRNAPIPRRLVEQAFALARDFLAERADERVLHGDLHYGNVLAADREPWVAIAPKALNGDPHYEVAPLLWQRWGELAGDVREGVRRRFYAVVDAAGFDEDRARDWVIVRAVHLAMWELAHRPAAGDRWLTRCIATAKAVQA